MDNQILSMREDYLASLPEKIENLEYILMQISRSGADDGLWNEFLRMVHSVKGGAGSFGVNFVGAVCHDFETYLVANGPSKIDVDLCLQFVDLLSDYTKSYLENSIGVDEGAYTARLRRIVPAKEVAGFKVLVVENTLAMSEYYAKILLEKYEVTVAYEKTGIDAFVKLMKEDYDALITSMVVGELDGRSLISALKVSRGINRSIPTFLITSDVQKGISNTGFEADFVVEKSRNLRKDLLQVTEDVFSKSFFIGLVPRRHREPLKSVLCIDDDELIFGLVQLGLKKLPGLSRVEYAESGMAAIERLSTFRPDLIIMDVMMPGLSGPETLLKIRENPASSDIPVIFLTGQEEKSEISALLDTGVLGVIRKPFDNKKLAGYINTIWHRKC